MLALQILELIGELFLSFLRIFQLLLEEFHLLVQEGLLLLIFALRGHLLPLDLLGIFLALVDQVLALFQTSLVIFLLLL